MKKYLGLVIIVLIFSFVLPIQAQKTVNFEKLDSYISKAVKDFKAPGLAVAVVKDNEIVFKKGYGYRDMSKKNPVTPNSLFNIASCTKAFTAATLGMLVEEGTLKWKDKVSDYIPNFKLNDPYITANMNMYDLLSHRCGLGTFYGDLLWYETDYSNEEIIERIKYLPLTKDFRSEFGYQNNMYMIAGEIVEKVTGKSWSEFMYERILNPLEMNNSKTCSNHLTEDSEVAMPHLNEKVQQIYRAEPGPAFSIYTSVNEISNWMRMLLNRGKWKETEILKPETIDELFSPKTILNVSSSMKENRTHFNMYGLGWVLFDYFGRKIVEHSGGMPGYISKVCLVPEENLGIAVFTNDMNNLPTAINYKILDEYLTDRDKDWVAQFLEFRKKNEEEAEKRRKERISKRVKKTKPSLKLSEYTGEYIDKMYGKAKIDIIDENLHITLLPAKEKFTSKMEHWHYDTFRIKFKDEFLPQGFVTFDFNSNAEITGFKIDLPNPDFHFFHLDFKKIK